MAEKERIHELVDAARDLFFRYGYKKTTLDDLAEAVGMTKSSLYHYFSSKEDLFKKVAKELFRRDLAEADQILNQSSSLAEALIKLQNQMRERANEVDPNAAELMGEMTSFFPMIRDSFEDNSKAFVELLKARLDRSIEEGEYRAFPTHEYAVIMLMLLKNSLMFRKQVSSMNEITVNWGHYLEVLLAPYRMDAN